MKRSKPTKRRSSNQKRHSGRNNHNNKPTSSESEDPSDNEDYIVEEIDVDDDEIFDLCGNLQRPTTSASSQNQLRAVTNDSDDDDDIRKLIPNLHSTTRRVYDSIPSNILSTTCTDPDIISIEGDNDVPDEIASDDGDAEISSEGNTSGDQSANGVNPDPQTEENDEIEYIDDEDTVYYNLHHVRKAFIGVPIKKFKNLSTSVPHYNRICSEGRNCNPLKRSDPRHAFIYKYSDMNLDQRRNYLKSQAKPVDDHFDQKLFFEERERQKLKISKDPILTSGLKVTRQTRKQFNDRITHQATRYMVFVGRDPDEDSPVPLPDLRVPDEMKLVENKMEYRAPVVRVRITQDITHAADEVDRVKIPVYTDINGEFYEDVIIPDSLLFDYLNDNVIDKVPEHLLRKAALLAEEDLNHIVCRCHSNGSYVNCFDNPECPCFMANKMLQKVQRVSADKQAKFHTYDPIMLFRGDYAFQHHAAFTGSEHCSCKGNCTNNVLYMVEKQVFPVEIYRNRFDVGFGVRSTTLIPAGMPVLEFCGEILNSSRLKGSLTDYSLQLTDPETDTIFHEIVETMEHFTPHYVELLKKIHEETYFIDCKMQGNVARFLNHSCTPNLDAVRVYSYSLSPAHLKLMLFTTKTIMPGEPLTIDYGPYYNALKNNRCRCWSFGCQNSPHFPLFSSLVFEQIEECFEWVRKVQFDRFKLARKQRKNMYGRTLKDIPKERYDKFYGEGRPRFDYFEKLFPPKRLSPTRLHALQ